MLDLLLAELPLKQAVALGGPHQRRTAQRAVLAGPGAARRRGRGGLTGSALFAHHIERPRSYNARMISREPTIERLALARRLLLEPSGLDDAALQEALGCIGDHRVDDCDLYFQITRHEGWSLEEGIVKSGSFGIDQGVGVRAVAGEKTAFAYSDDISRAALLDAARTVRSIAAGRAEPPRQGGRRLVAGRCAAMRCIQRSTRSPRSTARRRWRCSSVWSGWRARATRASCR